VGNYNTRAIRFRQSIHDFPLTVALGENCPSWALTRWRGNGGLRFLPSDDEGFTLRGDKRRFEYSGRRRSHRFTILEDGAFEYDVILLKEPESNIITLRMEGAECFDFFRQPDFVSDPFLRGSFAVYKKITMIGEGTGKLCHIHRPEVIDARGRRCWGELAIVGNELSITIPANWLGEAKYPVVVDPAIGTTTVGSQYQWEKFDDDEELYDLEFEGQIAVNRFQAPQQLSGNCIGYAYTNNSWYYWNDDYGGRPVIYSDSSQKPVSRKSKNEQKIDFALRGALPNPGWRSAPFEINGTISNGAYIWYGISVDYFWEPRFDYGSTCYIYEWFNFNNPNPLPNTFPDYDWSENFRLSMYFTNGGGNNYARTLTQGVNLTDNRVLSRAIKRLTTQVAGAITSTERFQSFILSFKETVSGFDLLGRFGMLSRKCIDSVVNSMNINRFPMICRYIIEQVSLTVAKWENLQLSRNCVDGVMVESDTSRKQSLYRKVEELLSGADDQEITVLYYRSVTDTTIVTQANSGIKGFIREIKSTASNFDGMEHGAGFYRYPTDTVNAGSFIFRKAGFFVRIATQLFISDLILGRFLRAKSEIILKSCVTRELTIESKIN